MNNKGMNQKTQREVIGKFERGEVNLLVATSIGEEVTLAPALSPGPNS